MLKDSDHSLLAHLAFLAVQARQLAHAADLYQLLLRDQPDDTRALLGLCYCLVHSGRAASAQEFLNQLAGRRLTPEQTRALERLTLRLRQQDAAA